MRVHSLTILHYGKDYLPYALRSIYPFVDQCHIFYTPTPSHGHSTNIPPIETKEELIQTAYTYDPDDKIKWYDMLGLKYEGQHRDLALETVKAAGADLVLVVDYDEVWPADTLTYFLSGVWEKGKARNNLVNMVHFWRSFNWACYDNGWPVRIIDLRQDNNEVNYLPKEIGRVYHFGYAVRDEIMQYKWQIHGHKGELRSEWLSNIWTHWPPKNDCHPTNDKNFWNPVFFDKELLPDFMKQHPFYDLDKID